MRGGVVLSIGLAVVLAGAADAKPRQAPGRPYDEVRAELLQKGWKAVPLKHDENAYYCGGDQDDFCKTYPEVYDCSGTGLNPCLLTFFQPATRKYMFVVTLGEERLSYKGERAPTKRELAAIRTRRR